MLGLALITWSRLGSGFMDSFSAFSSAFIELGLYIDERVLALLDILFARCFLPNAAIAS